MPHPIFNLNKFSREERGEAYAIISVQLSLNFIEEEETCHILCSTLSKKKIGRIRGRWHTLHSILSKEDRKGKNKENKGWDVCFSLDW